MKQNNWYCEMKGRNWHLVNHEITVLICFLQQKPDYHLQLWSDFFTLCMDLCIVTHTCSVSGLGAKFCCCCTDLFLFEYHKLAPPLLYLFLSLWLSLNLIASEGSFFAFEQLMVLHSCIFIGTSVIKCLLLSCFSLVCVSLDDWSFYY